MNATLFAWLLLGWLFSGALVLLGWSAGLRRPHRPTVVVVTPVVVEPAQQLYNQLDDAPIHADDLDREWADWQREVGA